jgi:hypothetical protein
MAPWTTPCLSDRSRAAHTRPLLATGFDESQLAVKPSSTHSTATGLSRDTRIPTRVSFVVLPASTCSAVEHPARPPGTPVRPLSGRNYPASWR